jgi:2-polyprenyl-6-methoxyphenol hydroxylase-like FAD-dependent oxidoreductase
VLPEHLLVVGGGPIGSELAQGFRRLGSEVTVLASRDRLLPRDDPTASRVLGQMFELATFPGLMRIIRERWLLDQRDNPLTRTCVRP